MNLQYLGLHIMLWIQIKKLKNEFHRHQEYSKTGEEMLNGHIGEQKNAMGLENASNWRLIVLDLTEVAYLVQVGSINYEY